MADTMLKDTKISRFTATLEMADIVQKYRSIQIQGYIGNGRHYTKRHKSIQIHGYLGDGRNYAKRHKSIQIHGYIGNGRHYVQKYTANYPDSRLHWRWQTQCTKTHSKLDRFMATPEMADAMYKNAKLFTMHKNTKVSTFTATMEMADTMYKNTNVSKCIYIL